MIKIRPSRRRIMRRAQAINLSSGEIRRPRRRRRHHERPPRRVRLPHRDMELPVVSHLRICLEEIPAVKRHDVRIDLKRHNRRRRLRKLLHYQELRAAILEEEKQERVPNYTL